MSDTPLTDAILEDEGKCNTYYAYVSLCRSLERENAALKKQLTFYHEYLRDDIKAFNKSVSKT